MGFIFLVVILGISELFELVVKKVKMEILVKIFKVPDSTLLSKKSFPENVIFVRDGILSVADYNSTRVGVVVVVVVVVVVTNFTME